MDKKAIDIVLAYIINHSGKYQVYRVVNVSKVYAEEVI